MHEFLDLVTSFSEQKTSVNSKLLSKIISDAMHLITWQIGGHFRGRNGSSRKSCLCCSETFPRKPREALQGDEDQDCAFQEGEYADNSFDCYRPIRKQQIQRYKGTPCCLATNITTKPNTLVWLTLSLQTVTYQLLAGVTAQLVEHCTGIVEVMESNLIQASATIFRLSFFNSINTLLLTLTLTLAEIPMLCSKIS